MEILRFIAWKIKEMSSQDRLLCAVFIWLVILCVNLFFFGTIGFLIYGSGILLVVLAALFRHIYKKIMESWEEYKRIKDADAQYIVDRLRGSR